MKESYRLASLDRNLEILVDGMYQTVKIVLNTLYSIRIVIDQWFEIFFECCLCLVESNVFEQVGK